METTTETQPIVSLPAEWDYDTMVEIPAGLLMLLAEGILALHFGIVGEESLAAWTLRFATSVSREMPIPYEGDDLTPPHGTPRP